MTTRRLGVIAAVASVALVAGVAGAAIPDTVGAFHACIKKTIEEDGTPRGKGELRVIDHAAGEECHATKELHVHFNEKGQKGDKGDTGDTGAKGDTGPQGPPGPGGLTGIGRTFSISTVERGVDFQPPDGLLQTGDVGRHIDLAIGSDGLPLISYYDPGENDLRVAHCSNAACTAATTTTLDSDGDVGSFTSLAIGPDGLGLIAYYDATNNGLKVAHCANVTCTSAARSTLDSIGDSAPDVSLTIGGDGLGLISYHDTTTEAGALKVAHCSNAACSSATKTVLETGFIEIEVAETTGFDTAIATGEDGLGLIAFRRHSIYPTRNNELRIAHCDNAACTAATISIADVIGNPVGRMTVVVNEGEEPPAAYVFFKAVFPGGEAAIRPYRCGNDSCSTGHAAAQIDAGRHLVDSEFSAAFDPEGLALVVYTTREGIQELRVAHCYRPGCGRGASVQTVDRIFGAGIFPEIAVGRDGFPLVAYRSEESTPGGGLTRGELRVVR